MQNMEVEKRRWSLEKQAVDLATSDIGLAPLPDNRFTRGKCGFKILQYAAAGLPVIASPVGVNIEYIREGINGFLAADYSDWIEKICQLSRDSQLRRQIGRTARTDVQRFDSRTIGGQLCELVKRCLKDTAS